MARPTAHPNYWSADAIPCGRAAALVDARPAYCPWQNPRRRVSTGVCAMGELRRRGKTWWIRYYRNGKRYEESAGSSKESEARSLLRRREGRRK